MDWGALIKEVAPVVAIVILFYWVLRVILAFVNALNVANDTDAAENRKTLNNLASAINNLAQFLRTQGDSQQQRADRNMLINMDRFDDLEYILEGMLPEGQRDRLLVVAERRKQRESKYLQFLPVNNLMDNPPEISSE